MQWFALMVVVAVWFMLARWLRPFKDEQSPMSVHWRLQQHNEKTGKDHR